jgi:predicted permease
MAIDPGFETVHALVVDTQWTFSNDPLVRQRRKAVQEEVLRRLSAVPGVERVGLTSAHPLGTGWFSNGQFIEMTRADELQTPADLQKLGPEVKSRAGNAGFRIVSDGYFAAMGIRVVRGRVCEETDGPDAPHVAVISESLAETKWPNQEAIGRYIQFGNMDGDLRGFRVVGIVSDVREISPESVPGPLFYGCYKQRMASRFYVVVRTDGSTAVTGAVRQIIHDADPDLPLQIRTIEDAFDRALAGRRFSLTLIGAFSVVALILATLGIYGLISYLVAERTREIGIRLALGAESADVLRLVVGRGILLAVAGIAVGLVAALALTRLLEGMLFGVTTADPVVVGTVMLLTLVAVLIASYLPARRALRVAPIVAMRSESVLPAPPGIGRGYFLFLTLARCALGLVERAIGTPRIGLEPGRAGHRQHVTMRAVLRNAVFRRLAPAARMEPFGGRRWVIGAGVQCVSPEPTRRVLRPAPPT